MQYKIRPFIINDVDDGKNYFIIPSLVIGKPNFKKLNNITKGFHIYLRWLTYEIGLIVHNG